VRRRPVAAVLAVAACAAVAGAPALADPGAVRAKRAEVRRIEGQVAALDRRVERAAEAYNGARWRLGLIRRRIDQNRRVLIGATRDLSRSQAILARRLRDLYRQDQPTLAEVILTSGSLSLAVDRLQTLERIGDQDRDVVVNIRGFRGRVREARRQLIRDRAAGRREVAHLGQERSRVEGLLRQREEILGSARSDLRRLIAEERERRRREAEAARQRALEAQRAGALPTPFSGPLPSGEGNSAAARLALRYLGVPYVWGGASPSGFDCSGLASYVYAQIGKRVPHYTGAIWASYPQVPSGQLQAGDLVFFNGGDHVGIYLGNDQFVHAPHTGDVVRVASLSSRGDYVGAVRP
jgi:peptidoglycan hydrolase CwlO-like protein